MHPKRWGLVVVVLMATMALCPIYNAAAGAPESVPESTSLSPYWPDVIQQWEDLIIEEAYNRGVDADLIASLMWKESRGVASARGPAGAVGLMMVMPNEAGFTWRPSTAELLIPTVNVFWGTRALATVIRQSGGDLHNALAAYNGGWGKIHLSGPLGFADDILNDYARAVAVRNGLSAEGHWVATISALDGTGPMTVVGPGRELVRYSHPPIMADIPNCTTDGAPTAVTYMSLDGQNLGSRVGVWILLDGEVIRGGGGTHNSPASLVSLAPMLRFP